jgi:hypothetical protein
MFEGGGISPLTGRSQGYRVRGKLTVSILPSEKNSLSNPIIHKIISI